MKQLSIVSRGVCYIVSEINQCEVPTVQIKVVTVFYNRQNRMFLVLLMWQFEIGRWFSFVLKKRRSPGGSRCGADVFWAEVGGVLLGGTLRRPSCPEFSFVLSALCLVW